MSGAATSRNQNTAKATTDDTQKTPSDLQKQAQEKKTQLEEDDEFEDFPMEGASVIPRLSAYPERLWNSEVDQRCTLQAIWDTHQPDGDGND